MPLIGFRTAAIGFPIIIMLLIPLRAVVIPRLPFTEEELAILDGPTASPFVSIGILSMDVSDRCNICIVDDRISGRIIVGWQIFRLVLRDSITFKRYKIINSH